jgi:cytochrome c
MKSIMMTAVRRGRMQISVGIAVLLAASSLGPYARPVVWLTEPTNAPEQSAAEALIEASDCTSCHAVDRALVGPSYQEVAARYEGLADAAERIERSIRDGSSGSWGDVSMTPHPELEGQDLAEIVRWILSRMDEAGTVSTDADTTSYTYTLPGGETIELDFQLFVEDQAPRVSRDVFGGYLLYNSYCFRCHGQDATESQLGPDLKRSLGNGMTAEEYLAVAMVGREDEGMPSWAGFLTAEEVRQTYMYVEGRRLGLVPVGRPPSDY